MCVHSVGARLKELTASDPDLHRLVAQATAVVKRLQGAGHETYFVGGVVRDILLGRPFHEIDITTAARPEEVRALFRRTIPMGEAFGVITVMKGKLPFEVATFRCEEGYSDGRHPDHVRIGTLAEDVLRRDFTINGLVFDPATEEVTDLVNGVADLNARIVRAIGEASSRMNEDYLRTVRAARFAATLDFELDPETLAAVKGAAPGLAKISRERVRNELVKLVDAQAVPEGLELLGRTQLAPWVLGQDIDAGVCDAAARLCRGVTAVVTLPDLLVAVALARWQWPGLAGRPDLGDEVGTLAESLRLSNAERKRLKATFDVLTRIPELARRRLGERAEVYRSPVFLLATKLLASMPALEARHRRHIESLASEARALPADRLAGAAPLSGKDLLALGVAPGPRVGELLKELSYGVVEGTIASKDDALAWLAETGAIAHSPS